MIFGKIFHLSKEGSKAIVQAGIWLALFNLAALLPVILLAMASEKMITLYYADSEAKISLLPYALALAVILAVMFVTYKVAYHKEYLTSGQEEYKLRMELADKLRRLPLSFFWDARFERCDGRYYGRCSDDVSCLVADRS